MNKILTILVFSVLIASSIYLFQQKEQVEIKSSFQGSKNVLMTQEQTNKALMRLDQYINSRGYQTIMSNIGQFIPFQQQQLLSDQGEGMYHIGNDVDKQGRMVKYWLCGEFDSNVYFQETPCVWYIFPSETKSNQYQISASDKRNWLCGNKLQLDKSDESCYWQFDPAY